MKATEVIREMIKKRGYSEGAFARMLGVSAQVMSARLGRGTMRVEMLSDMAKVLGYKVVLVPISKAVKEDEYEVTE